jgi:hypothetical protein
MPAQKIVSYQDGPRLTLAQLAKAPTVIPERIVSMMDQQFLVDSVLRKGDDAPGGVVLFSESTPLFTDDDPAVLDEFGEIPVVAGSIGTPKVVRVVRRAMGLRVSKTMMDRNAIRAVTNQMTQIKNTMIRAWEDAFFSALLANPNLLTVATDTHWGAASGTSHIRKDINSARYLIKNAASDAAGRQKFGFEADTLILSTEMELDFLDSDEVAKPYIGGDIASENLQYTGKLPNKFLGLDVLVSWRMAVYAPSSAIVLQRKVVGFISDERPLETTPMYGEGNGPNGGPREAWRCDTTRASAIGIDQPKAACLITGVTAGETPVASGSTITATS